MFDLFISNFTRDTKARDLMTTLAQHVTEFTLNKSKNKGVKCNPYATISLKIENDFQYLMNTSIVIKGRTLKFTKFKDKGTNSKSRKKASRNKRTILIRAPANDLRVLEASSLRSELARFGEVKDISAWVPEPKKCSIKRNVTFKEIEQAQEALRASTLSICGIDIQISQIKIAKFGGRPDSETSSDQRRELAQDNNSPSLQKLSSISTTCTNSKDRQIQLLPTSQSLTLLSYTTKRRQEKDSEENLAHLSRENKGGLERRQAGKSSHQRLDSSSRKCPSVRNIERDWFGFKELQERTMVSKVLRVGHQNSRDQSDFSDHYCINMASSCARRESFAPKNTQQPELCRISSFRNQFVAFKANNYLLDPLGPSVRQQYTFKYYTKHTF